MGENHLHWCGLQFSTWSYSLMRFAARSTQVTWSPCNFGTCLTYTTDYGITRGDGQGGYAVTNHGHASKWHESVPWHVQLGADRQSTSSSYAEQQPGSQLVALLVPSAILNNLHEMIASSTQPDACDLESDDFRLLIGFCDLNGFHVKKCEFAKSSLSLAKCLYEKEGEWAKKKKLDFLSKLFLDSCVHPWTFL